MFDPEHLEILNQGIDVWNVWRKEHPEMREPHLSGIDLSGESLTDVDLSGADLNDVTLESADLRGATLENARLARSDLSRADLRKVVLRHAYLASANLSDSILGGDLSFVEFKDARLENANLSGAWLPGANLMFARLTGANLSHTYFASANFSRANLTNANFSDADGSGADGWTSSANLSYANLSGACFTNANLFGCNLFGSDLSNADLSKANLQQATLVNAIVTNARFTECKVHGISVWNLHGEPDRQDNLHISREDQPYYEPIITVDNLEVAQFIYMLITYKKLRDVIQAITSKVVLILGRFTEERLVVLKALQEALRQYKDKDGKAKYLPVMFDFDLDKASKDLLETVQTIAGMSRFILADISAVKGVPLELGTVAPYLEVPIKLIFDLSSGEKPVEMLGSLTKYDWFMEDVCGYRSIKQLCAAIEEEIINPAEQMVEELQRKKERRGLRVKEIRGSQRTSSN